MHFHQPLVTDLTDGKEDIRQLYQNQPRPERITEMIIADHRRTNHRQQRTEHITPAQTTPLQQVINQCHIQGCQHGKQQEFRNCQVVVGMENKEIHNAELTGAHRHIHQNDFRGDPAPAQKRQKNQGRQRHTD